MPLVTMNDLKEETDDEKRQAYYAGGQGQNGGGSGQEILDPREFMKRAHEEMGAQSVDEWQQGQPAAASTSFTGAGQSLSGATTEGAAKPPESPKEHTITFYKNGFTVDDTPLEAAIAFAQLKEDLELGTLEQRPPKSRPDQGLGGEQADLKEV